MSHDKEDIIVRLLAYAFLVWLVAYHILGRDAEAAEGFTSVVIRCQQSDICLKREIRYPSEQACEAANEKVVAVIGETDDIVIAYCVGESE